MAGGYKKGMVPTRFFEGCYTLPNQYAETANSLLHGHVHLDLPMNKNLQNMQNPYDYALRCSTQVVNAKDSTPVFFDVAFFRGHYYQYFGVLPVILFFIPYKLLTGNDLNVGPLILLLSFMIIAAIAFLSVQLVRMMGKRTRCSVSVGSFVLVNAVFVLGIPIFSLIQLEMFYTVPQLCAVFFAVLSIAF